MIKLVNDKYLLEINIKDYKFEDNCIQNIHSNNLLDINVKIMQSLTNEVVFESDSYDFTAIDLNILKNRLKKRLIGLESFLESDDTWFEVSISDSKYIILCYFGGFDEDLRFCLSENEMDKLVLLMESELNRLPIRKSIEYALTADEIMRNIKPCVINKRHIELSEENKVLSIIFPIDDLTVKIKYTLGAVEHDSLIVTMLKDGISFDITEKSITEEKNSVIF